MKVEHIIFDLDNTLYSSTSAMDAGITRRMMEAVAEFFGVDVETAAKMRRENLPKFSTTLEWLRSEGLSDTEKYFGACHKNCVNGKHIRAEPAPRKGWRTG